jgi:hypothetical protein
VVVATLACREQGLAIGAAAARLHGLDGFEDSETVHVALPKGRALRLDGVVVSQTLHTYPRQDRYEIDGIACAGLARVVCDIAPLGRDVLERSIDDFQRRGHSLIWLERTAAPLRVRGRPAIADVLAEIERRTLDPVVRGSWFERLVEECVRSPLIPGLVRQHEIRGSADEFIARVDLAVPAVRLAIEAHSRRFHAWPSRELSDEEREARATEEGWQFEYVTWRQATQTPAEVRRHIERLVARRARDLGVDLAPN